MEADEPETSRDALAPSGQAADGNTEGEKDMDAIQMLISWGWDRAEAERLVRHVAFGYLARNPRP